MWKFGHPAKSSAIESRVASIKSPELKVIARELYLEDSVHEKELNKLFKSLGKWVKYSGAWFGWGNQSPHGCDWPSGLLEDVRKELHQIDDVLEKLRNPQLADKYNSRILSVLEAITGNLYAYQVPSTVGNDLRNEILKRLRMVNSDTERDRECEVYLRQYMRGAFELRGWPLIPAMNHFDEVLSLIKNNDTVDAVRNDLTLKALNDCKFVYDLENLCSVAGFSVNTNSEIGIKAYLRLTETAVAMAINGKFDMDNAREVVRGLPGTEIARREVYSDLLMERDLKTSYGDEMKRII